MKRLAGQFFGEDRDQAKRLAVIALSAGLTVLIGYIIFRGVPDWRQSLNVTLQAKPIYLIAAMGFIALHMVLRAARWGVLLRASKPVVSYSNLLSLTLVKYVLNVIPPRSGEVAASIAFARKEQMSSATVIATSVFERILDAVTVIVLFGCYVILVGLRFVPDPVQGRDILLRIESYSLKVLAVVAFGVVLAILLLRTAKWTARLPAIIRKPARCFVEGFRVLQSKGAILQVLVFSLSIWLSITLQTWCVLRAYLPSFPVAGSLLIMAMAVVGVAIPTPGGVGGYQYFVSLGLISFFRPLLSPLDPHSQVAGISNGCYLLVTLPLVIGGLVCLNKEGLTFGRAIKLGGAERVDSVRTPLA